MKESQNRKVSGRRHAIWAAALVVFTLILTAGCGTQAGGGSSTGSSTGSTASGSESSQAASGSTQGQDKLSQIKAAGVMTFATDGAYPPDEFIGSDGKLVGFDADLGKAIAKQLGVQWKPDVVDWDGIIPGLAAGKYDAILSSMNITPERSQQIDFIRYMSFGQFVVVRADNTDIHGKDDLKGKTIAVQTGTTNQDVAKTIPDAKITLFDTFTDAMLEVANGRADATILDGPVAQYYQKTQPDKYKIVGDQFNAAPVGLGIAQNEPKLKKALTDIITKFWEDGTMKTLGTPWFGGAPLK